MPRLSKVTIQLETDLLRRFKDGFSLIQVILGPRQVGKTTTILKILKEYSGAFHYVSAESDLNFSSDWLSQVWQEAMEKDNECLLVIDEIQKVQNWSEQIKTLWDRQKVKKSSALKVILLGSSSLHIQAGLAESLTGRFELIRAYHWSFHETENLKKMSLSEYLKFGGYPGSYEYLKSSQRFQDYIRNSIVSTVIEKDLLIQGRVRNPGLFKQTFQVLQRLPAVEMSYTKLLGQLQDKGNTDLIKNYLDLYEGAYLFKQVHKYNPKAFRTRLSSPKIICMAPALLDFESKEAPDFLGLCFESLVGADLIRSGLEVYYWRQGDFEIDFLVKVKSKIIGIEVKSQKRKSSNSVSAFKKAHSKSQVIYINFDNYQQFARDPVKYIGRMGEL